MYKARNPCKRLESDCNDIGSKYIESNSRSGCRGSRGRRIAKVRIAIVSCHREETFSLVEEYNYQ